MKEISILHLEDDAVDAALVRHKLEASDVPSRITHVQTREAFERELDARSYDLILADFRLPAYDGIAALRCKMRRCPDTPFIFVSGTIGEEAAINGLVEGATDYVLKQKLARLAPAVRRAITESMAIQERKRAEEALRISEYRKTILNRIASIFLLAPDEEATTEILSYLIDLTRSKLGSFAYVKGNGDLIALPFSKGIWQPAASANDAVIVPAQQWSESPLRDAIEGKRIVTLEQPFCLPSTDARMEHLILTPILFGNQSIGLLCFGRDESGYEPEAQSILREIAVFISPILNARLQRDRLERARKQAELELIAAKEKAEENDRLKSAFLQNVSHEIRTPMNAICGFSYLLNEPGISDEQRKNYTDIIQASSKQLLAVVSYVLTISSLETKQTSVNLENVCLSRTISELRAIFSEQASQKRIRLIVPQTCEAERLVIATDQGKLVQILTNLLSNAIKFTREGTVEFGYRRMRDATPPMIEFFVRDSGIGVEKDAQEAIFERFQQANKTIQIEYGGMGLGLSISKGLVELLGGSIGLQSEPGRGSTFSFAIPYLPEMPSPTPLSAPRVATDRNAKTVLVVEDKEYNYLYVKEILSRMNRRSAHARDGQEAVAMCRGDQGIGLVLMDIKMPHMDGCAAAKIIKEARPDLPIIAQSAYAIEFETESYRSVFDDYLTKPLDRADMMRMISKY